ncbi:aminotransferase-like domain-containing protein [Phytohabitans kaempferiae]|uniref:PLP-dependent aminotransferase family protein n=1 Tax=Phytohabitans kaempferiae TaxID=1620943 RepID=A0ABV6LZ41_9ACTN
MSGPTAPDLARRTAGMRSSKLRDLIAVTTSGPVLSLAGGLPPPEAMPLEALAAAADRLFARGDPALLQYSTTEGDPVLREVVAADLRDRLGLPDPAGRLIVTTGSQQALDLVGKVLLDPGDAAVVESPTYVGALRALAAYEPRFVGIPVDESGMDTDHLAGLLARGLRPKLCYTVPNFANPSGTTLAGERRGHLAELAARYGFLVVEDDPYGQLRFAGADVPPVARYGEQVLYLGSFSKLVAPGLRVGYAAAPPWLVRPLAVAKQATDLNSSSLAQRLVAEALAVPGWFEDHLAGLRALYRSRAAALVGAIGERLGGRMSAPMPDGGMFTWAELAGGGAGALEVAKAAMRRGVAVVPGDEFSVTDAFPHALRLSFSMLPPEHLVEAVQRLAEALDELSAR